MGYGQGRALVGGTVTAAAATDGNHRLARLNHDFRAAGNRVERAVATPDEL